MTDLYDVIVIGAGAAGLTASAVVGALDKRVALIERDTWVGIAPGRGVYPAKRS
jgi:pyruvate/2-oxoglutarate dehydrogenase complex dihydrolipoamide dehydrogenase (E3) component